MTPNGDNHEIEIFAAGNHTSSNGAALAFSTSDLDAIAQSYNPQLFDAPAVVGHPRDNSPAYGWVESVRREGNKLIAKLKQVDADFQEAVKAGRYKKISASFYSPDSSANPNPGSYYLRHVGFLGGMAPAVKGLKSVAFAEGEEGVVEFCSGEEMSIFRNLREWFIAEHDLETADRIVPSWLVNMQTVYQQHEALDSETEAKLEWLGQKVMQLLEKESKETNYYTEETEEEVDEEENFSEQELRIQQLENELAAQKSQRRREAIFNFVEGIKTKIPPIQRRELVEFMCALPEGEVVEFSEGKPQNHLEWLQGFIKSFPDIVTYREISGGDDAQFSEESKSRNSAYENAKKGYENAWKGE